MKIKAIKGYYDKQLQKDIKVDDVYEVNEERANQIISVGFAIPLPVEEKKQEEVEDKKIKKESKSTRAKKK